MHVQNWERCSPVMALSLLTPRQYPLHPTTVQYAVRVLRSYPADALLMYIPQIVQAVRHDNVRGQYSPWLCRNTPFQMGYVTELIVHLGSHSQLLAHQLIWNMQTNMFTDEDSKCKDPVLHDPLRDITARVRLMHNTMFLLTKRNKGENVLKNDEFMQNHERRVKNA